MAIWPLHPTPLDAPYPSAPFFLPFPHCLTALTFYFIKHFTGLFFFLLPSITTSQSLNPADADNHWCFMWLQKHTINPFLPARSTLSPSSHGCLRGGFLSLSLFFFISALTPWPLFPLFLAAWPPPPPSHTHLLTPLFLPPPTVHTSLPLHARKTSSSPVSVSREVSKTDLWFSQAFLTAWSSHVAESRLYFTSYLRTTAFPFFIRSDPFFFRRVKM